MKTLTTSEQLLRIRQKGITVSRSDNEVLSNYSYFQLINAYKSLFISGIKSIDCIKEDIDTNQRFDYYCKVFNINKNMVKDNDDLYRRVLLSLKKKYLFECVDSEIKSSLERIDYIHHVYHTDANIKDFIRILKFEHRLRAILMKYVLIIEENIKNILCTYLNDIGAENDFLLNISNYNLSNPNRSVTSLGKTMNIIRDNKSLPLNRKIEQQLLPSYWITIHASTLNGVIRTIQNLKPEHFKQIQIEIYRKFSDPQCYKLLPPTEVERKSNSFFYQLISVGDFRNQLAHNNPIYQYNVQDSSLKFFPAIKYSYPKPNLKKWNNESVVDFELRQKRQITGIVVSNLRLFQSTFGRDWFNTRTNDVDINLSYLIYLVNKIVTVLDSNNTLSTELRELYFDFGITNYEFDDLTTSYKSRELQKLLSDLQTNLEDIQEIDVRDIIPVVNNGSPYVRLLQSTNLKYKNSIKESVDTLNKIKEMGVEKDRSYELFKFNNIYKRYTGIDGVFLRRL